MSIPVINLRKIDEKRLDSLHERTTNDLDHSDIWYIHTVLAQCFLPYSDPKTDRWRRQNGKFSISLVAGDIEDPRAKDGMRVTGLPYGAKPRLFQSYICTQVIKQQSPVISVERSMTAMMQELGVPVAGIQKTTIRTFTVEGEEKNEGLRPRLSWVEATDIFHVYCRILPGIWVFFHTFSRWLCLLKTSLVIIH